MNKRSYIQKDSCNKCLFDTQALSACRSCMGAFRFSWFNFLTLFVLSSLPSFSAGFFSLISLFTFFSFFFFFSFFAFRSLPWVMPRKRNHVTLLENQLGNSDNHQLIDMEPLHDSLHIIPLSRVTEGQGT